MRIHSHVCPSMIHSIDSVLIPSKHAMGLLTPAGRGRICGRRSWAGEGGDEGACVALQALLPTGAGTVGSRARSDPDGQQRPRRATAVVRRQLESGVRLGVGLVDEEKTLVVSGSPGPILAVRRPTPYPGRQTYRLATSINVPSRTMARTEQPMPMVVHSPAPSGVGWAQCALTRRGRVTLSALTRRKLIGVSNACCWSFAEYASGTQVP